MVVSRASRGDKKYKETTLKVVTNPFLISLFLAVAIITALPPIFQKYKVETVHREQLVDHQTTYYADLNGDGTSEKIEFRQLDTNFFSVTVFENQKIFNQWNFQGKVLLTQRLPVATFGDDSSKSFYFFSYKDHKIYLHGLNPLENKFITRNKFVTDFFPVKKNPDCHFHQLAFFDSDNNGVKDFYFYSETAYSKQPRRVFEYDPVRDTVYSSVKSYADLNYSVLTLSGKDSLNFIFATRAVGNSTLKDPYSDLFSWLMDIGKNLSFRFEPIRIGVYPSASSVTAIKIKGHEYFVVLNIYFGTEKHSCSLRLYNPQFKLVKERKFPFSSMWDGAVLYSNNRQSNYFYIINNNGLVEKRNASFKVISRRHLPPLNGMPVIKENVDGEAGDELIFESRDLDKLIIARSDFSNYVTVNSAGMRYIRYISLKLNGHKSPELVVSSNAQELILSYGFNDLYYLKYPVWAGIYLTVLLMVLLIEKGQRHRSELRYQTEKNIAELQLKAIKNQIDPHFTLNTLNSIGSLIYKQDRDKADYVFGKYSKLLRQTILNSDKILTTLSDELDYVENYLELEQFRNGDKFNWNITVPESIKRDVKIPKMLIHTFVENAVKHGLRHLDKGGELTISIDDHTDNYTLVIRDNGIGRQRAQEIEIANTGKGLGILDQILDLYYKLMKVRITYSIRDRVDNNGDPLGTEARIKIPVRSKL